MLRQFIALCILYILGFSAHCDPSEQALFYLENFTDASDVSEHDQTVIVAAIAALSDDSFIAREKAAHTISQYQLKALPFIARAKDDLSLDTGLRLEVMARQIKAESKGLPPRLVENIDRLVEAGDVRLVPRLLELIENDEEAIRHHAAYALRHISGQTFAFCASNSKALREMAVKRWLEWWTLAADDFAIPKGSADYYLLTTAGSEVKLLRKDGEVIWTRHAPRIPHGEGNPPPAPPVMGLSIIDDDRLALTSPAIRHMMVMQRGWVKQLEYGLRGKPNDAVNNVTYRAATDTFMLSFRDSAHGMVENKINEGYTWRNGSSLKHVSDARALPNDHILFADLHGERIREIDRNGVNQWEYEVEKPARALILPNGNLLTNDEENLIEVDRTKETVWSHSLGGRPHDFARLPDGRTAAFVPKYGLVMIDTAGTETMLTEARDAQYGTVAVAPTSYLTFPDPD